MKRFRGSMRIAAAILSVVALTFVVGCSDDDNGTTPAVNHAPVISSVQVSPPSVSSGGSVIVTVVAVDADGDQLSYTYTPNGGSISGSGPSVTWLAPTTAGNYSVSVSVSDGEANPVVSSGALTVIAAQTGIRGTIAAPAGVQVDLRNILVRLYTSFGDYAADAPARFIAAQGTEFLVTFEFTDLPPGNTYYVDAWKDMDSSGNYSAGDVWSVYATGAWPNQTVAPIIVTQGSMANISSGMVTFLL